MTIRARARRGWEELWLALLRAGWLTLFLNSVVCSWTLLLGTHFERERTPAVFRKLGRDSGPSQVNLFLFVWQKHVVAVCPRRRGDELGQEAVVFTLSVRYRCSCY